IITWAGHWFVLGMTYAFLYWGRYNLQVGMQALGSPEMIQDFNWIFGAGTVVYGLSFIVNGPLTDRKGGRFSILAASFGAAIANLLMGLAVWAKQSGQISDSTMFWSLVFLYIANMYFQSFGAVAVVKVNAHWFHVRERGTFGAIFGILISLGIYFAFDWSYAIIKALSIHWAFVAPGLALAAMWIASFLFVRDQPNDAGYANIRTGDASEGDSGPRLGAVAVFKMMMQNKIIVTIALIEFCSGFLRQSIMQMYRFFAKSIGTTENFVYHNWGLSLCVAGILGGVFAGIISDHVFQSRRAPVAIALYGLMLVGILVMFTILGTPELGWVAALMSLAVIGVHGMLSGTASMDFGGTKNVGVAVGIIDGFVYLGTGAQALLYANILPKGADAAAKVVENWYGWPLAMLPLAGIGLVLAYTIRNAKPQPKTETTA
ncbi:MAG TPA: MFS transporter, partial [Candidatus Magasanikbacteria bacterium]|nr:MFS transporter [Candidatus Magasanikbacteria bacterium]